jgi:Xaa-Pro aminopeptidase
MDALAARGSTLRARARVLAQMPPGAVAVLATAPEVARNSDSDYLYRHDSYFYYLTGFTEPEAVLVLVAAQGDARARHPVLPPEKSRPRNLGRLPLRPGRRTRGLRLRRRTPSKRWTKKWPRCCPTPALYYPLGGKLDARVAGWLSAVRAKSRTGVTPPAGTVDLLPLLDEMRLLKDADEQATMQRAAASRRSPHPRHARRAPACMNTNWKRNCCTNSAAMARRRRPTPPSSPRAPMPACCTTAPTTRRRATATWY